MRKQRNGKKGFTMVELAVSFALAGGFFASLLSVLAPVYRTYRRTRDYADALLIAGNVIDSIRTTANAAKTLTAEDGVIKVGRRIAYSVSADGRLQYTLDGETAKDVYDEKFYNGNRIALVTPEQPPGENIISVTVVVTTPEGTQCQVSGVISPLRRIMPDDAAGGG